MDSLPDIFTRIKPFFEKVIKDPKADQLITLNEEFMKIEDKTLQVLQDYFLQQLIILSDNISGQNKNEIKTKVIECILTILKKTRVEKTVVFKTTLIILLKQIYDNKNSQLHPNLSEEFKIAVLRSFSAIGHNLSSDIVEEIYVKDNIYLISQVIFVCVEVLLKEKYRKLKYEAIDCILSTMQIHDDADFDDIVLRYQVSDLVFIILPKLLASLCVVITGDQKQGTSTIQIAVKALGRILCLVFQDYENGAVYDDVTIEDFTSLYKTTGESLAQNVLGLNLRDGNSREEYFANATRSKEWLTEADKKILTVLNKLNHLRGHPSEIIKLEFTRMCCEMVVKCSVNMKFTMPCILENIIALSQDEDGNIKNKCDNILRKLTLNAAFLENNFDELFHNNLLKMPRIIYRGEEGEQLSFLLVVKGYLMFFSDNQRKVIVSNGDTLQNLMMMFLAGAELEKGNVLLLREYTAASTESYGRTKWKTFKNFKEERCELIFVDIIHTFHSEDCLSIIVNYILENLYSSKSNNNEFLLILSELIVPTTSLSTIDLYKNVLEEIMQECHWNLDVDHNEDICDQKYNILHICLVLKCVGNLAVALDEHFKWYLYDILHHVLEKSGCNVNCIHEMSDQTLTQIATSLKYQNVHELIHENLDYLSQSISKSIKKQTNFQNGINVLQSVLRYVPYDTTSTLENTISPILTNIIQSYSERWNAKICLQVLQIFIKSIGTRFPNDPSDLGDSLSDENYYENWMKTLSIEIPNENVEEEELLEEEEVEEEQVEEEEEIPYHIVMSVKILNITSRYISSNDQTEKIIALEIIDSGINILQNYENQLLPLVHDIWYTFTERFKDKDPIVLSRSFDVFVTLAKLAKDFIRKDSLNEIFPKINDFLKNSLSAGFGEIQTFKLQKKILENYATLIISLQLHEKDLDITLDIINIYAKKSDRKELREVAEAFFEQISLYDPTAVFIKLKDVKF